jgi:hypothetical protein
LALSFLGRKAGLLLGLPPSLSLGRKASGILGLALSFLGRKAGLLLGLPPSLSLGRKASGILGLALSFLGRKASGILGLPASHQTEQGPESRRDSSQEECHAGLPRDSHSRDYGSPVLAPDAPARCLSLSGAREMKPLHSRREGIRHLRRESSLAAHNGRRTGPAAGVLRRTDPLTMNY